MKLFVTGSRQSVMNNLSTNNSKVDRIIRTVNECKGKFQCKSNFIEPENDKSYHLLLIDINSLTHIKIISG